MSLVWSWGGGAQMEGVGGCPGKTAPPPTPFLPPTHLEEVDLHAAVAQVQDDGAARAEPGAQVGQPGQLIPFPRRDVGTRLQQVLAHVVPEILEEGDLGGEREGVGAGGRPARAAPPSGTGTPGRALTFFSKELGCEFTVR